MKTKLLGTGILAAALATAPLNTASAHEFHHGGALIGLGAAVGAVVVGAAMLATAPIRLVADAASAPVGPVYAESSYPGSVPVYAAPAPVYAPQPQAIYAQPVPVYATPVYAPAYGYGYYPVYYGHYGYGHRGYR